MYDNLSKQHFLWYTHDFSRFYVYWRPFFFYFQQQAIYFGRKMYVLQKICRESIITSRVAAVLAAKLVLQTLLGGKRL